MKSTKKIFILIIIIIFISFVPTSNAFAQETQSAEDLQTLINNLLLEVVALQTQLKEIKGQEGVAVKSEKQTVQAKIKFTRTLKRGISGKDVEEVQEYLAQFPDIYPEGLVTGYFGPLTEKAIQKFQKKYEIVNSGTPSTTGFGQVGPKTSFKINELITKGAGASGVIPPGLTDAPGLEDKIDTTPPVEELVPSVEDDTTVPVISDIQTSSITETGATIVWTTDEAVDSQVEYSKNTPIMDSLLAKTTDVVTSHRINLVELEAGTTYYFSIIARDANLNITKSAEQSFITVAAPIAEPSDLIGHWTFDDAEGAIVNDSSENGSTGSVVTVSSSPEWVNGQIDGALKFDGVDDYVSIPHSEAFNIGAEGDSYTVSMWFNRSGVPNFERNLLSKQEGASPSPFEFKFNQNSYVTFRITDGSHAPFITPPKTISGNGWNHIVGVRNVDTDRIYVYINGEEGAGTGTEKGMSVMDTTIGSIQNDDAIWINRYLSTEYSYYDPFKIDDVRIYNRALSEEEIKTLYDEGGKL